MSPTLEVSCRAAYRSRGTGSSQEHACHLESLSASGCTIRSGELPDTDLLELEIHLQEDEEPLRVHQAKLLWGGWTGFTLEFEDMPARDQRRLREYLWTVSLLQEQGPTVP